MSNDESAVPRLVAIDRRQLLLRTVDVEKLVEPEHCVRSIWELVWAARFAVVLRADRGGWKAVLAESTPIRQLLISLWLYAL